MLGSFHPILLTRPCWASVPIDTPIQEMILSIKVIRMGTAMDQMPMIPAGL